ncbi:antiviral reverse transcriptase Drt3b [Parasphingorhabdus sp.]|uniref:antiviral reverse transcriptase Drt3b n=1 Tax=Parasphingorhabdus sp. TaxID=2709688 RepID=UPI003A8EE5C1
MRKRKFIKGNIHRDDHLRALVTDTLPAEVPIIFSNDGFYLNERKRDSLSADAKNILNAILDTEPNSKRYNIPYRYRVTKDTISTRRLSLLHPRSQISVTQFYRKFEELICYYNSRSTFSIRAPTKVGSTYFYRSSISDKNRHKTDSVDTLQFEKRVRNPASYFAYQGHDRLYKFFESSKFERLEKKFPIMWFGDVSKCFDSIYTHTLTWAVKDMPSAKENISAQSFGNSFDLLMQKMNYNETNGICIGPETSRIFAETILQKVDCNVSETASKIGLVEKKDYECFRYVDDIIIFAQSNEISKKIYELFEDSLGQFNLHLNDLKLQKFKRPFHTPKSNIIHKLKIDLSEFSSVVSEYLETSEGKKLAPANIYRTDSVRRTFLTQIKSTCTENKVGYDMVSNYVVASLSNLLENVLEGYTTIPTSERKEIDTYHKFIVLILDILFFFYTVNPTVSMSFSMSKSIVQSIRFTEKHDLDRSNFLIEILTKWTLELLRSIEKSPTHLKTKKIPVEVINIVLALSESSKDAHISSDFLKKTILDTDNLDYFSTVSLLFFIRKQPKYRALQNQIEENVRHYFLKIADVKKNSHDAHLFLDYIVCPYISLGNRERIVQLVNEQMGLPTKGRARRLAIVKELELNHWFVNWQRIDLLNMIKRKELSAVY